MRSSSGAEIVLVGRRGEKGDIGGGIFRILIIASRLNAKAANCNDESGLKSWTDW
jgi:hypothetical protein